DAALPRRLQHVQRPPRVAPLGVERVRADEVDVGGGRQVDDDVAGGHRRAQPRDVAQIADALLDVRRGVPLRRALVEDPRPMPSGQQTVDDVRADESGAARHEHVEAVTAHGDPKYLDRTPDACRFPERPGKSAGPVARGPASLARSYRSGVSDGRGSPAARSAHPAAPAASRAGRSRKAWRASATNATSTAVVIPIASS